MDLADPGHAVGPSGGAQEDSGNSGLPAETMSGRNQRTCEGQGQGPAAHPSTFSVDPRGGVFSASSYSTATAAKAVA